MRKITFLLLATIIFAACNNQNNQKMNNTTDNKAQTNISEADIAKALSTIKKKFGDTDLKRVEKGINQIAALWTTQDGTNEEFVSFCAENFIEDQSKLEIAFEKISRNFEILWGNFNKIGLDLRMPLDLTMGEITNVDMAFGSYSPGAHIIEDFYNNKIAFQIALNFPAYSLKEKEELSPNWDRKQWAYARLGDVFTSRVPSEVLLNFSKIGTESDTYIAEYNVYMGKLVNDNNETLFPEDLRLITHWGLRDELKSNYNAENGLEKQKMIYQVMKRIISQEIPQKVINKNEYTWNPYSNKLTKEGKEIEFKPEPNTRYERMLANFKAIQKIDKYNAQNDTYVKRKFDEELEIPIEEVEALFVELVSSPQIRKVGKLIKKRLGRDLEPFDIWYDGFKARNSISEADLNKKTQTKYPNKDAFQADLVNILIKLGFANDKAKYLSDKIQVDGSRGAGHAAGASMKGDKARLRTRFEKNGMNYKGYNIAVHEFGHNVEQTISLYDVDYYMLNGVPNTGFTEALAFLFQKRDLELLGIKDENPNKFHALTLDNVWAAYEIMGVSLVDMKVWKWLYENPEATAEELKNAVIDFSKEVWNKYYADVFGSKDETILGIYSHMIAYPLYLPAYPIGQVIEFQVEEYLKNKDFAQEVERMFKLGRLTPQQWMKQAVGEELSVKPLLNATDKALKAIS